MTACATTATPDRPAEHRLRPPPSPEVPRGSVACTTSPTGWCLSKTENDQLLIDLYEGILLRDRKLCWLLVYHGYKPCPTEP